jgi:hypothetical protein
VGLVDLMRPQGSAAPVSQQVPMLAEGTVVAVSPGLMVALDDPDVQYGPVIYTGVLSNTLIGRGCLVAFVEGDPGRGWALVVR